MDYLLLQKFREQLTSWIVPRLASQRLPFQRLENCPRVFTEIGWLTPDLVLWINRDSLLAGSMILLPDRVDEETYRTGTVLASALGLGHFATWAAQDVSIWSASNSPPEKIASLELPAATQVTPEDFHQALDWLLEQLKLVTVTTALAPEKFSKYYYANLCLHTLEDLSPGLTDGARHAGGQSAADDWVEQAPLTKAWMSLWRLLFLLRNRKFPLSLQPERLETAIRYALADLASGPQSWLKHQDGEAPLPESSAIRLHHLAGRLKQLGWPRGAEEAQGLFDILLEEAAGPFGLATVKPPWVVSASELWVNCQPSPSDSSSPRSLVAPKAVLAGWLSRTEQSQHFHPCHYAESLFTLPAGQFYASTTAALNTVGPLLKREREQRTLALRHPWPSRRFDLPRNTPTWVWDALHLTGMTTGQLSLILPKGWHSAPGLNIFWGVVAERHRLVEAATLPDNSIALRLVDKNLPAETILLHKRDCLVTTSASLFDNQQAGLLHVWMEAAPAVTDLLQRRALTGSIGARSRRKETTWGTFLFLHTSLGQYLWRLCNCTTEAPVDPRESIEQIINLGMPLPDETILADLSLLGNPATGSMPTREILDLEFSSIFGEIPRLDVQTTTVATDAASTNLKRNIPVEDIASRVFVDGVPRFPAHYLMNHYRPVLKNFKLPGPLHVAASFFDTIRLQTKTGDQAIEVDGRPLAEALILASHSGMTHLEIPVDETLTEDLVNRYRMDLQRLWESLTSECRRYEPRRQSAIHLAKKIWHKQGLPPSEVFSVDESGK